MVLILRAVGFLPMVIAAKVRREERRLVRALQDASATSPGRATALQRRGRVGDWVRQRLIRRGAIGTGGGDRYYLIESGYVAYRRSRRRRAALMVAVLLIAVAIALYYMGDPSL